MAAGVVEKVQNVEKMLEMARQLEIDSARNYNLWANECSANTDSASKKNLRLREERLQLVTFQLRGCVHMYACCNALSTLDREHYHCAELALTALFAALADCQRLDRESWKKVYRRG